jgi:hypothetical protein
MSRSDLQALTADDLAALANRGLVKRAQKEVEAGEPTVEWGEADDSTVTATWSDGVTCTLPGGQTVSEARCTCPALELCRHVLRTVLAWQRDHVGGENDSATEWDPGSMTGEDLQAQVTKPVLARAADLWSQGVLAELLRGRKPSARFHMPGHTVRFPVPADLRYAQCSCPDPSPCVHAVLAVRAFGLLPVGTSAGIVNEGAPEPPLSHGPLEVAVRCVMEMLEEGFATLGTAWRDKVRRASAECHAAGVPWPAGILEELAGEFDRYVAHDGAFAPATACSLVGELLLRIDAIRSGRAPVPQAFLRGMASDRDEDLGGARFIGLGSSIRQSRTATTVHVFLQDCTSGHVVTLEKSFTDDPAKPKAYHELARATAVKDASLALLSAGQLVTQGGRRTATGRLVIGRSRAVVNPQDFSWEQLKAPVLVEDFGELAARLRLLPPASFRPRQETADFHVCPVAAVVEAAFDPLSNSIVAVLADHDGRHLHLRHPWSERGARGAEALLAGLLSGRQPHFVAGQVKASAHHLKIRPTAFVLAGESGPRRGILPWTDAGQEAAGRGIVAGNRINRARYHAVQLLLEDVLLNGLRRTRSRGWPGWAEVGDELEGAGCHRMAKIVTGVPGVATTLPSMLVLLKILALEGEAAAT